MLVWFKAPDQGLDIADALTRFVLTLESRLPGLQLVHLLEDPAKLEAFLPSLTRFLERARVLIVVDNIESLLTGQGAWRDARWAPVIAALAGHGGLGRVIMTSRRRPAGLDPRVRVLGVDALSADEALLLARQLPHLSALIEGQVPGIEAGLARDLGAGVLEVAQGHPKLLELADGQAARPERLQALVDAAGDAWRQAGGLPEGFFTTGETTAGGDDFLHVLGAWTRAAAGGLTPSAQDLFWFLCCLEETDRSRPVLEANWADLWHQLGRDGDPPGLDEHLAVVAAAGLAAIQPETEQTYEEYGIHPGIAAAGRHLAGQDFQDAADTELASFWASVAEQAKDREAEAQTSGLVVRAGLSAAPYLLRLRAWVQAGNMLQEVLSRDSSRATAGAALPSLRAIAAALNGTNSEPAATGMLAQALARIDTAAAERQTAHVLAAAVDSRDYRTASAAAGHLINYLTQGWRLAEALRLVEEKTGYTRQAGLGPWTQLGDQVQRLQVLDAMGRHGQVLAEVHELREHMATLPPTSQQPEAVDPFDIREALLDTGYSAAMELGQWEEALELNAAQITSITARGAPQPEVARARFNSFGPLRRLGRLDDAVNLLLECRLVFEDAHDIQALGKVFSALAIIESLRGHGNLCIGLERDALRYSYLAGDIDNILTSHHNMGGYLYGGGQSDMALAHHLTAALLLTVSGSSGAEASLTGAAMDLRAGGDSAVPASVAELCRRAAEVPGVRLDDLLAGLTSPQTAEDALRELIAQARAEAAAPAPTATGTVSRWFARWDPVIAGLAAASQDDTHAAEAVREYLAEYSGSQDWAALAAALLRMLDGDRGEDLAAGLDEIDTAIVTRALGVLAGEVSVPSALWLAMGVGPLLGGIVAAAGGSEAAAGRAREDLAAMAGVPELAALAGVLGRVLDGDRDPGLAETVSDGTGRAVVATVLAHIPTAETGQHSGKGT